MKKFLTIFFLLSCHKSNCQTSYIDSLMSGQKPLTSITDCELWMNYLDTAKVDNANKKELILKRVSLDTAKKNIYFEGYQDSYDQGNIRHALDSLINLYPPYSSPLFIINGIALAKDETYRLFDLLARLKIKKIVVIKRNDAISLYGVQALGGVIIINSKVVKRKK